MAWKDKTTAQRIRAARRAADLTQGELADKCQINRVTVSSWERGLYKPEGDVLKKLAFILGVPEDYILGRSEADALETPLESERIISDFCEVPVLSNNSVGRCKSKAVLADLIKKNRGKKHLFWPCDAFEPYSRERPPFAISVDGNYMEFCGIYRGDTVIINPATEPEQGSAVLVWLFGLASLVYYYKLKNGDVLLARGEERQRRISKEKFNESGFEVIGAVVGSLRPRPSILPLFLNEE